MRILIDKYVPFIQGILEPYGEVEYLSPEEFTAEKVKNADALIIRTRTRCNAALLNNSQVRFIATATIGFDHIDTHYCESQGITWQNAAGCNADAVRQYVEGALHYLAEQKGFQLKGKTLGVVGVGHVGTRVVAMAERLGMHVLRNDPPRARKEGEAGFCHLEKIAREADIITFHTPLIKEGEDKTYHLCNAAFLQQLKSEACLINAARGGIIDEQALLASSYTSRSIIDCWEGEPRLNQELLHKVCAGTPHIAGYSLQGKANATTLSVQGIARFYHWEKLMNWEAPLPADYNPNAPYDITVDHQLLMQAPDQLERLRDEYKLR